MTKDSVADWDTTAANNTDVGGVDIAERCLPSGLNNAIREVMAQAKTKFNTIDTEKVAKAGDTMTGDLTIQKSSPRTTLRRSADTENNFHRFMSADGIIDWQLGQLTASGNSDFVLQRHDATGAFIDYVLRVNYATGDTTLKSLSVTGLAYPNTIKWDKSVLLSTSTDLNTVLTAGQYSVQTPVNGPWSGMAWAHLEVQVHASSNSYARQRINNLSDGTFSAAWERVRNNGTWSSWKPVSGFSTPEHFGGKGSTTSGAASNQAAAIARWLAADVPKLLDQFYIVSATDIAIDITGKDGFQLYGVGGRGGVILTGGSSITISGANPDNPQGINQDQFTIHDVNIIVNQNTADVPLKLSAADGDSGSNQPGVDLCNVNVIPADTLTGSTFAQLQLHNIREGSLRNVSVAGKYGAYAATGILHTSGDGSAPVEVSHFNCRASHVQHGFFVQPGGTTPNDDMQGYHWTACTALAVDRGFYIEGGPEGFGEWFTVENCHAYFREAGVITNNAGNLKINDNYFLGHGALSTINGVAALGSSIESWCDVLNNRIRLDAATGGTRVGVNMPSTLTGKVDGNRITGHTTATLLPGTWYGTNY